MKARQVLKARLCWVVLLAAALWACGGREARPSRAAAELDAFTEELVRKVEGAGDAAAGVAEARKLLGARREELRATVLAVRRSGEYGRGGAERERWEERESENVFRVSGLRTKYMTRAMEDAAFRSELDALVADYQKLFEP